MDPTVLVALITGVVTATSTLGATALAAWRAETVERWRAEHNLDLERERRANERERARVREVRQRLEDVRHGVHRLDQSMRQIGALRRLGPPGEGGNDLAEEVRECRGHLYEAVIAVERVRDLVPTSEQEGVDRLRDAVDRTLGHVQARPDPDGGAEPVHRELMEGLRELAEVFGRGGHDLVPAAPEEPV